MAISVIKEKRDGTLKGRTCTDGRGQRGLYSKEETAVPTVHYVSFMMMTMIEAKERRFIAVGDVKGAFLVPDMPHFITVKCINDQVDAFYKINPKHIRFTTHENKNKVLCVVLKKSLH